MAEMAEDELLEIEREFWEAEPTFHDAHYDDRFVGIVGDTIMGKDESVRSVAEVPPLRSLEMEDVRTVRPTDDTVVVAYRAIADREGRDTYRALVGSVYVRRDGEWRNIVHQHTPLAG